MDDTNYCTRTDLKTLSSLLLHELRELGILIPYGKVETCKEKIEELLEHGNYTVEKMKEYLGSD